LSIEQTKQEAGIEIFPHTPGEQAVGCLAPFPGTGAVTLARRQAKAGADFI